MQALPTQNQLFLWLLIGLAGLLAARITGLGEIELFLDKINNLDVISLGVLAVAAWRLNRAPASASAVPAQIATALAIAVISVGLGFVPSTVGIGAGFAILGVFILRAGQTDPDLRAAAICLLALASHLCLAPIVFRVFLDPILQIDRYLVGWAFTAIRPDIVWSGARFAAPDGLTIAIVGGCSSFGGISVAIAVHIGWAMRVRTHLTGLDAVAILATAVLATAINITRLILTGWDQQSYAFWHGVAGDGPGLMIAWFAQTTAILIGGYLSATWAAQADR